MQLTAVRAVMSLSERLNIGFVLVIVVVFVVLSFSLLRILLRRNKIINLEEKSFPKKPLLFF